MEEVQLTEQQKLLLTFAKTLQSTISNNYVVAQKRIYSLRNSIRKQ